MDYVLNAGGKEVLVSTQPRDRSAEEQRLTAYKKAYAESKSEDEKEDLKK